MKGKRFRDIEKPGGPLPTGLSMLTVRLRLISSYCQGIALKRRASHLNSSSKRKRINKAPSPIVREIGGCMLIALIVFIVYIPAINGGFIWDDDAFLTQNPLIRASDGLYRFWFSTEPPDYFPLTSTTLWFEWRLWGENATGYHVVNLLLHILNSILIWFVLKKLKVPGAWLAALIFGIHPINVESVAWITERKNLLPMSFFLLSIIGYLEFDKRKDRMFYIFSLTAFLLALLSKTSVVMLPFVLLGLVWWQHGKVTIKDWVRSVPFFALSLIMGGITVWFQYHNAIGTTIVRDDGFLSRLAGAGWALWFYLDKAVIPLNLSFVYPRWDTTRPSLVSFLPLLCLATLMAVFYYHKKTWGKPFLAGIGYVIITLFPVLGFLNIYFMKYSLVADHWQYTSIIGIIALAVGLIAHKYKNWHEPYRRLVLIVAILVGFTLSLLSWKRAETFAQPETLWRDTLDKNPACWMAHDMLGAYLSEKGQWQETIRHFQKALEIEPDYPKAHSNLANVLYDRGRVEEAFHHFEEALKIDPNDFEIHYNFGTALAEQRRLTEAIQHYQKAVTLKPGFLQAHYNLGALYAQQGNYPEAIRQFSEVLRIDPANRNAHNSLIRLHQLMGRPLGMEKPKATN